MKMKYLAFVLALILTACGEKKQETTQAPRQMPPVPVTAVLAEARDIDDIIFTTGSILPNEEVVLKPEISGRVIKINFNEGTSVSKGQLLLKLNDRDLKAQLSKLGVQIDLARQDESRKKQLLERKAISQEEYDRSESTLQALLAEKEIINASIEKTEIYAPFSGKIGLKYISEGANITSATNIANLIQLDPVKIEFSVPERYAGKIKQGTKINFTTGSGDAFSAEVYAVEGQVDRTSRTYKVRAKCSNRSGELVPGSFVKIEITLEKINGSIILPSASIVNELTGHKVYTANGGLVRSQDVEIGIRTDTEVQILSGLNIGDTILTSGLLQVKNNSQVIIKSLGNK